MKLSDYVMEFLQSEGVKDIFMLPGGGNLHLSMSLMNSNINCIVNHHEMAAAMAAEAYAKHKNDLGVVLVTSGPGATHTITACTECYQDSVPCLFLSGQVKDDQTVHSKKLDNLRQVGVQEVNIVPIVDSITKYSVMVEDVNKIKYYLQKAVYLAKTGRPGPVWLDIPINIQGSLIDPNSLEDFTPDELDVESKKIEETDLVYVMNSLKSAKRPIIVLGRGVRISNAINEINEFIVKYDIPIVSSYQGIDIIERDSKYNIGCIGFKGTRFGNIAVSNADLIISIGCRLSMATVGYAYELFSKHAKLIVVDVDSTEHNKDTVRVDKFIHSDAKDFMIKLSDYLEKSSISKFTEWLQLCNHYKKNYPVCKNEFKKDYKDGLNLYHFIEYLTENIKKDIPIVTDTGSALFVTSQVGRFKEGQRYIPSGFATMGFSLPGAIGASFAKGKKKVVALSGDGSFQQNLQELQTVVHHQLPIKLVILNNNGYYTMKPTVNKGYDSEFIYNHLKKALSFPSFEKLAFAYGIKYIKIAGIKDMETLLEEGMILDEPVLFDVITSNCLDVYTVTTMHRPDGGITARPLADMFPFLERKEFNELMLFEQES